ncbi:hypothetical protein SAMN04488107_4027 [Geodermatophilus saharensis]|uniref:DUF222 domain-containing protein n=1 Tax=Geodermatophilus saharensis TaxID=1137994 RepID=A0A239HUD0_9ACTN|nr:hypothetical protein [Geodermatophilus saharensis]SNS85000.1 hypothetical protein SAMN04488107_4027 [Geodermatophilus saharensis]
MLHVGHLWCLLEHVAPIAEDALRARVESELLSWLAGRSVTTPAQLGDKVRRMVLAHAARDAARDLARAVRRRGVSARPDRVDGMSVVSALLTTPEAATLLAALGAYADALPADPADGRTRGQEMADCLLELVLRPGECGLPPVQVALTVVAPAGALLGGDAACEIDGQVVPAEVVRALLAALTGHRIDAATDTEPTDPGPTGTASTGTAPTGTACTSAVVSEEEDFARWMEEMERRILAGKFDAEPAPCYLDEDGPPPDTGPDDPPPDRPVSPVPDGWWARADRAVDDASTALLTLDRALGHARRLVATAERADTAEETTWAAGPAGRVSAAPDALTALAAATDQARADLAGLLGRTAGGGLADRPRLALTDTLTGALLALTDLPALRQAARAGTGLVAPGASPGYRPAAGLDRYVRARDRCCRFIGCRHPVPRRGELDHHTLRPAGPTTAANLAGYCTGHHRPTALLSDDATGP